MNKKKHFAQYYTPEAIANILAQRAIFFLHSDVKKALELASGDGQLLNSLLALMPNCKMTAIDIDQENIQHLIKIQPTFECIHHDALTKGIPLIEKSFDLALANPPFISDVLVDEYKQSILAQHLEIEKKIGSTIRSEILFLCQYMNYLAKGKVLSIIMPASLISGERHSFFRRALLNKFKILEIYQVIDCDFVDTEAETYIITISNSKPIDSEYSLKLISNKGAVLSDISVHSDDLINRMDPKYYGITKKLGNTALGDVASITRGNITHKELKFSVENYLHTTNFNEQVLSSEATKTLKFHSVKKGDVIMCRVGKRILGKTKEYTGSNVIFSDCIYRIRFEKNNEKKHFLKFITSKKGKSELMRISKGVCSKYLTIKDLRLLTY